MQLLLWLCTYTRRSELSGSQFYYHSKGQGTLWKSITLHNFDYIVSKFVCMCARARVWAVCGAVRPVRSTHTHTQSTPFQPAVTYHTASLQYSYTSVTEPHTLSLSLSDKLPLSPLPLKFSLSTFCTIDYRQCLHTHGQSVRVLKWLYTWILYHTKTT